MIVINLFGLGYNVTRSTKKAVAVSSDPFTISSTASKGTIGNVKAIQRILNIH